MTWRTRSSFEHVWTALVIGSLVFVISLAFITYTPDEPAPPTAPYHESPAEKARIEKRMAYHGLIYHGKPAGIIVMRDSDRGWEFYRDRDGQWCKL